MRPQFFLLVAAIYSLINVCYFWMLTAPPFHPGDLVRRKLGGPQMVVESVGGRSISCSWRNLRGEMERRAFSVFALERP
jgi:uncharacterized protein YodC (DUF2158 family)